MKQREGAVRMHRSSSDSNHAYSNEEELEVMVSTRDRLPSETSPLLFFDPSQGASRVDDRSDPGVYDAKDEDDETRDVMKREKKEASSFSSLENGTLAGAGASAASSASAPTHLPASVWIAFLINFVATTLIVVVNKRVLGGSSCSSDGLALLHFLGSLIVIQTLEGPVPSALRTEPAFPMWLRITIGVSFALFVFLSNSILSTVSVGFYQVTKIAMAPMTHLAEVMVLGLSTSWKKIGSVSLVCLGMGTFISGRLEISMMSLIAGLLTVLFSASYQILVKMARSRHAQKIRADSDESSPQLTNNRLLQMTLPYAIGSAFSLMLTQLLVSSLSLVPESDAFGPPPNRLDSLFGCLALKNLHMVLFSCILAVLITASSFYVVGVSPLAYNLIGHMKTVSVLLVSWTIFGETLTFMSLMGISLALGGVILFSTIRDEY